MTDQNTPDNVATATQKPKKENMLINLLFNIVIPTLILMKLSGDQWLGTTWAIVVALAFPLAYGGRDLLSSGKVNFFSVLGVVSILLTGGISLLHLDATYIAIKEAAIPGLLGLAIVVSPYTRWPLVKTMLYKLPVLDIAKITQALRNRRAEKAFESTLQQVSWIAGGSFFTSSALNYLLAKWLLISPPGTEAFNAELGKMTALSYPVIVIPSMAILALALFFLFRRIGKLTGLKLEEIIREP